MLTPRAGHLNARTAVSRRSPGLFHAQAVARRYPLRAGEEFGAVEVGDHFRVVAVNAARHAAGPERIVRGPETIASEAMRKFAPASPRNSATPPKSSAEYQQELERIEQGIRTFDGINQVKIAESFPFRFGEML